MPTESRQSPFHVMAKPAGAACNLDCTYCFYLEKMKFHPRGHAFRMSDEVLDTFTKQYIEAAGTREVNFAWQGGEPLLMGLDFFRKALELQRLHANGRRITNSLQTNGTLINKKWGEFLAEHQFLVGISIDGPRDLHNRYRPDRRNKPTFDRVMRGIQWLRTCKVEFNTLTVVSRANAQEPLRVYRFLKKIGSRFHQYIPLVERLPDPTSDDPRLTLAGPPDSGDGAQANARVTEWSVDGASYGRFMTAIFDEWVRQDVGQVYVQLFDDALSAAYTGQAGLCVFRETCGENLIVEHDGTVYSCDHYVYPDRALGSVLEQPLGAMARSPEQRQFGDDKRDTLPAYCLRCEVRFACNGGCPKHRFILTPEGEPGLNYLCAGYKAFFNHAVPYLRVMCDLLEQEQPPARITEMLREKESKRPAVPPARTAPSARKVGRNDPCPCGSGKKFKSCCGKHPAGRHP